MSFGIIRDTCDCYAELKKLSAGRRESIDDYIGRAQILYDNIIQAEKNEKQSLTNSDISRINCRFIDEFYYGIPSDIRTLVEKRDDLTSVEFYQIVEKANHRLEKKYDSQQAYAVPHTIPRYEPGAKTRTILSYTSYDAREAPRNPFRRSEWRNYRNDSNRHDSRKTSDVNTAQRDRTSGMETEPGAARNKWNGKWCRYCKTSGHEIEECRKLEYNNTQNNHAGNLQSPSRPTDKGPPRASSSKIRPVKALPGRWKKRMPKKGIPNRSNKSQNIFRLLPLPITTICMKGLVPKPVFMLHTGTEPNPVKARCVHPDTRRKDTLYIEGITDDVESLRSIQVSFKGHSITIDIVPDDFRIPQEEILGSDFLKKRHPRDIRYNGQGFVRWRDITIPCTVQNSVVILARSAKVFYLKIKNPEIKTGLVPLLDLDKELNAGNGS